MGLNLEKVKRWGFTILAVVALETSVYAKGGDENGCAKATSVVTGATAAAVPCGTSCAICVGSICTGVGARVGVVSGAACLSCLTGAYAGYDSASEATKECACNVWKTKTKDGKDIRLKWDKGTKQCVAIEVPRDFNTCSANQNSWGISDLTMGKKGFCDKFEKNNQIADECLRKVKKSPWAGNGKCIAECADRMRTDVKSFCSAATVGGWKGDWEN